ncbi:MAG: hypothetical protein QQN63_02090 [Nitrosopumilus sp.]
MWKCEKCGSIPNSEIARNPTIESGLYNVHMDCGSRVYWGEKEQLVVKMTMKRFLDISVLLTIAISAILFLVISTIISKWYILIAIGVPLYVLIKSYYRDGR